VSEVLAHWGSAMTKKKRVLQLRLRSKRRDWDMVFVESGAEALQALGLEPYDVVITDMRMPQMDGEALLRVVRERHPAVARMVLSGHADQAAVLRTAAIAHHYLPKPCAPGALEQAIDRVCAFHLLISDDAVKAAVGHASSLPAMPALYSQLVGALSKPGTDIKDVALLLSRDTALSAKLLQLVNSAYFGVSRPIFSVEEAIVFLGMATVTQFVLAAEVFAQVGEGASAGLGLDLGLEQLQSHSTLTASIAAELLSGREAQAAAFSAGLLHDVGTLLIATSMPERMVQIVADMKADGASMMTSETKLFGVTHAELGGCLLGMWHLPFVIVEAVANHHAPARVQTGGVFDVVGAVHVANVLAWEQREGAFDGASPELDLAHLESLGVAGKLGQWRESAARLAVARKSVAA